MIIKKINNLSTYAAMSVLFLFMCRLINQTISKISFFIQQNLHTVGHKLLHGTIGSQKTKIPNCDII